MTATFSTRVLLDVGRAEDLPDGEALRITPAGAPPIAIFNVEGEFFAIDDTCTHQDASLAAGWVEDCRVECPLHESTFSLSTGSVDQPPAKRGVRVHEVRLDGEDVMVELSQDAPNLPPGVTV